MLSILIPTYNYVCAHLVCELQKQCEEAQALLGEGFRYEIIVADDGSSDGASVEKNAVIDCLPYCQFIDNADNRGRSAIRNQLAQRARHEWLLFIDADAEVTDDDYIQQYIQAIADHPTADALVGGILHPDECPSPRQSLRYHYEKAAERRFTAACRQQQPYASFRTFNFMIRRDLCLQHPFDEHITEYGYEDVLLGMELQAVGANIVHIDNPLLNGDIEDNKTYLSKIETALRTLRRLEDRIADYSPITILKRRLSKVPCALACVRMIYKLCRRPLHRHLLSSHPTLPALTFYKFGYYLSIPQP